MAPTGDSKTAEAKHSNSGSGQRKHDSSSGSSAKKLASVTKRANRDIARIHEAFERVRGALLGGTVGLAAATEIHTAAVGTVAALQTFAEGTVGCTDAALAQLQEEPSFVPFSSLALPPAALEREPRLSDVVGALSESLVRMHAVLVFVQDALAKTTSVRVASKIAEAVKAAKASFVVPVSSLLDARAATTTTPADQAADKAAAPQETENNTEQSKSCTAQEAGEKDHKDEKEEEEGEMKGEVLAARLQGCCARIEHALADCDKLAADIEHGAARKDTLVAFVAQVRPFTALERHLCDFVHAQGIAVAPVPAPADASDGIAGTVQVLRYHMAQSRAHLDAVVAHVAAAPRPLAPALVAALDALVASSEALSNA